MADLNTSEASALLAELKRAAPRVMGRCSYEQKEDAIAEAFTKMLEMRQIGKDYPIAYWIGCMKMRARIIHSAREQRRNGVPIEGHNEDGEEFNYLDYVGKVSAARQIETVAAWQALTQCRRLPKKHQAIILRRADGANPIEIAEELQMSVETVLSALADARTWLEGDYV